MYIMKQFLLLILLAETSRFEKFDQAKYDEVYGKLADGTFKPLRDVNEEGTSYTLDQISDGTIEVTEVK